MPRIAAANRFPAQGWSCLSRPNGRGRACRAPPLRPWEASDGSLRNFTGMTREEDTALVQFHLLRCIIPGSLRRLIRCIGGGFRFPPPPMSEKERKFSGKQGTNEATLLLPRQTRKRIWKKQLIESRIAMESNRIV